MLQIFPLRIAYLVFTALIVLVEVFRNELSFMLRVKLRIVRSKALRLTFLFSGIALSALSLLFPIDPGPVILGDFVPALALLLSSFRYYGNMGKDDLEIITGSLMESRSFRMGIALLIVAALDLLFPSFIFI